MMSPENLDTAIAEAERFIERAKAVRAVCKGYAWAPTSPITSAARRSSMELTRALAKLRSPERTR